MAAVTHPAHHHFINPLLPGCSIRPPHQPLITKAAPLSGAIQQLRLRTMALTKITQIKVSAASVMAGAPLEVRIYGIGQQKYCGTFIVIDQLTPKVKKNYGDMSSNDQFDLAVWLATDCDIYHH